ncbi:MAG: hypothetical protein K6E34_05715 [Lachnospiraceae bacterium]|nr:hypothetical protein [Lachnospiraceae bacterium]
MLFYEVAMSYKSNTNLIISHPGKRKRFSEPVEEGEFDFDRLNRRLANHFDKKECMVFAFDIKEKLMLAMALHM